MTTSKRYHKIDTLFKRGEDHKVIEAEAWVRRQEFRNIRYWHVTEKVDGTNIRIEFDVPSGSFWVGGRTDNAQIPASIYEHLTKKLTQDTMRRAFEGKCDRVHLFGEGYGPKIQKGGGGYRDDVSFALFDVFVHDDNTGTSRDGIGGASSEGIWLRQHSVTQVAQELDLDRAPIISPQMELPSIIKLVKLGLYSPLAIRCREKELGGMEGHKAEGIVARAINGECDRQGRPVMFKLKHKDFA